MANLEPEYQLHYLEFIKGREVSRGNSNRLGFYGGGRAVLSRIIDALASDEDICEVASAINDELHEFATATRKDASA